MFRESLQRHSSTHVEVASALNRRYKLSMRGLPKTRVETEGVHADGIAENDSREQVEAQTPLGRI